MLMSLGSAHTTSVDVQNSCPACAAPPCPALPPAPSAHRTPPPAPPLQFPELNAEPVVPAAFPEWAQVMDGWGGEEPLGGSATFVPQEASLLSSVAVSQ